MRKDLERLLEERELDGLVAFGSPAHSAPLWYLVKGAELGDAWYLCGRGGKAHLIHNPMERDAAAGVGVDLSTPAQNHYRRLLEESSSPAHATARMLGGRLREMGISGRLALYGMADVGTALEVGHTLEREFGFTLVADSRLPLTDEIRYTKDPEEVETTRRLGAITCEVMGRLRDHLSGLTRANGTLRTREGGTAVLGNLRRIVRMGFAEHGLVEPHGSIIAQGRDAGVPHNRGNDAEPIRPGEPIVVDIFPQQTGGGYHFDMTRTFCVGPARPEVKEIYETVKEAHLRSLDGLRAGSLAREHQDALCDFFESKGHATIRQDDRATEGYVHSLGHGLGLELHERPRFSGSPGNSDALVPGTVFTMEPGLYYPSRGLGVRIEDVVVARDDGSFENLTDFPLTLEL